MNNAIAEFGYNTDGPEGSTAWAHIGSKYNFSLKGKILGIFSFNGKEYLLSQVINSFGDDCMAGTIDAREVIIDEENSAYILISNNEPSEECMEISRMLSSKDTIEELSAGKLIEQTKGFEYLTRLGIQLERKNVQFREKVIVCGVEPTRFESFKSARKK